MTRNQRWETHNVVSAAYEVAQEIADELGGWDAIPAAEPHQMDDYDNEIQVNWAKQQAAAFVAEKE